MCVGLDLASRQYSITHFSLSFSFLHPNQKCDHCIISTQMSFTTRGAPSSGSLYQLSQVYSSYGYEPKAGTQIQSSEDTVVTGSNARVYYKRPSPDAAGINKWETITFTASDGSTDSTTGTVTLVPPSGALVGSDFLLDSNGWTITGNKANTPATHEAYSRGALLNHYVYGTDNKVRCRWGCTH